MIKAQDDPVYRAGYDDGTRDMEEATEKAWQAGFEAGVESEQTLIDNAWGDGYEAGHRDHAAGGDALTYQVFPGNDSA